MREERLQLVDDPGGLTEIEPLGRVAASAGLVGSVVYCDVVFVVVAVVELFVENSLGSPVGTLNVVMEFADVADLGSVV